MAGLSKANRENNLVVHNLAEGEQSVALPSKIQHLLPEVQAAAIVEVKRLGASRLFSRFAFERPPIRKD